MNISSLASSCLLFSTVWLIAACGNESGPSAGSKTPVPSVMPLRQPDSGLYRAILRPLNENVAGRTRGTILVRVSEEEDEFRVEAAVAGAPAGVKHFQHITTGSSCPDASHDTNGDGVVDVVEGMVAFGNLMIPLDSNLNTQLDGSNFGPIANAAGAYVYARTGILSRLLDDLRDSEQLLPEGLVKIPADEPLNLAGRVLIVHGVGASLPGSVATTRSMGPRESLPIACGILTRIQNVDDPTGEPAMDEEAEEAVSEG
jgi:hypothetical protein